jgi:hypothetical protein
MAPSCPKYPRCASQGGGCGNWSASRLFCPRSDETRGSNLTIYSVTRSMRKSGVRVADILEVREDGATLKVPFDGSALALERPEPCLEKNSPVSSRHRPEPTTAHQIGRPAAAICASVHRVVSELRKHQGGSRSGLSGINRPGQKLTFWSQGCPPALLTNFRRPDDLNSYCKRARVTWRSRALIDQTTPIAINDRDRDRDRDRPRSGRRPEAFFPPLSVRPATRVGTRSWRQRSCCPRPCGRVCPGICR